MATCCCIARHTQHDTSTKRVLVINYKRFASTNDFEAPLMDKLYFSLFRFPFSFSPVAGYWLDSRNVLLNFSVLCQKLIPHSKIQIAYSMKIDFAIIRFAWNRFTILTGVPLKNLSEMNKFIHYSLNFFFPSSFRKYIMHTKSVAIEIFSNKFSIRSKS